MEPGNSQVGRGFPGEHYRFDDVVIDVAAHTLVRAGQPVSVEPKAYAVLLMLLRHAGTMVGRDDLLDAVWGHRHVTPGVLTRAIAQLRAALDDDPHQPRYIQTQHALGYRFIGALEQAGAPEPVAPMLNVPGAGPMPAAAAPLPDQPVPVAAVADYGQVAERDRAMPDAPAPRHAWGMTGRTWWLAVTALLGVASLLWWVMRPGPGPRPSDASVAVLPFSSLSSDRDDRYFAEGLAVEMHNALAGVAGLKVAAQTAGRGKLDADPKVLGQTLGVATVLDATVRREGTRVRINARLTDTRTGFTLWSESYDRQSADVFALQSEIADKVVHALMGVLPASRPVLAKRLTPTRNAAAYDAYLRGLHALLAPGGEKALDQAIGFFRQALAEDAGFARAQAGICRAEIDRFEGVRDTPAFERARAACKRAADMDATLLDVSLALGDLERVRGEFPQAIEHYTRALDDVSLRPDAYIGLANTQAALGNSTLALDYFERAHQLRPGDADLYRQRGYHHYVNGNVAQAIDAYRIATTLQPDNAETWGSLGGLYLVSGRRREAADAFTRSLAIAPSYASLSNFASMRFEEGAYAEAATLYRRAAALEADDFRVWGNIGDATAALPETAAQARSPYARAAKMASDYLAVKTDDAQGLALLAWYRANLDQPEEARQLLARAESLGTEKGEVAFFAAQTLARLGDVVGARQRIDAAQKEGISTERIMASPLLRPLRVNAPAAGNAPEPAARPPRA